MDTEECSFAAGLLRVPALSHSGAQMMSQTGRGRMNAVPMARLVGQRALADRAVLLREVGMLLLLMQWFEQL